MSNSTSLVTEVPLQRLGSSSIWHSLPVRCTRAVGLDRLGVKVDDEVVGVDDRLGVARLKQSTRQDGTFSRDDFTYDMSATSILALPARC